MNIFEKFGKQIAPTTFLGLKLEKDLIETYESSKNLNFKHIFFTNIFFLSSLLTIISIYFVYEFLFKHLFEYVIAYKIIFFFLCWTSTLLFYYYLICLIYYYKLDDKFKTDTIEIEKNLPEFIDNLTSNLKGGIAFEKALVNSVPRGEKFFLKEVTFIATNILLGKTLIKSIEEFRDKFKDSSIISRTFLLILIGLKGGGNIVNPLKQISKNLKKVFDLDSDIKANIQGFVVVIKVLVLVIAPLLFALGLTLLDFIGELIILLAGSGDNDFLQIGKIPTEYNSYLLIFSYFMIVSISIFSSLIISSLNSEKFTQSLKYLPTLIVVGIILFNLINTTLSSFFLGIIG